MQEADKSGNRKGTHWNIFLDYEKDAIEMEQNGIFAIKNIIAELKHSKKRFGIEIQEPRTERKLLLYERGFETQEAIQKVQHPTNRVEQRKQKGKKFTQGILAELMHTNFQNKTAQVYNTMAEKDPT